MAPPTEVLTYAGPLCLALAGALNLPLGIFLDSPSVHDSVRGSADILLFLTELFLLLPLANQHHFLWLL